VLTELDWLHAIVYTDGWDVLADELLLTVPGKAGLTHVLLLKAPWRKLIPSMMPAQGLQASHLLMRQDLPVPMSPMDKTLILTTLLRAVAP
jgi:hypothetical protein